MDDDEAGKDARVTGDEKTLGADARLAQTLAAVSRPDAVKDVGGMIVETSFTERYQLRKLLGAGGMGEVRLMADQRIGRGVAMKVLRGGGAGSTESSRVRFVWEARVQAQLEHPAIVPVYDMGLTPERAEYFTMKRIGGRTLSQIIAGLRANDPDTVRDFPRTLLLGAFRQVCLAVEYAHRRGVIHRDLKPDNIMLGELGEVYVLDWGLAKVSATEQLDKDSAEAGGAPTAINRQPAGQSVDGAILGTPGYMSPEQASGNPNLDATSDVYALGAVLFEILTLSRLHPGEHLFEVLRATIVGVAAEELFRDTDVAPELVVLCAAATRRSREDRLSSAQALADGVQRFLDGHRDAELRTRLAEDHARAAEAAAEGAREAGPASVAARQRALQEAGRALALDPSSTRAASTLMSLLLEPPREVPPEVEQVVAHEESEEARAVGRQGIATYIVNGCVAILAGLVLGIHDITWIVAIVTPQWLAAAFCFYFTRQKQVLAIHVLVVGVLAFAAIGADSGIAGPLILVPGYAAAQLVVLNMSAVYRHRFLLLGLACLAVLVPVGLEYSGWITPAYEFVGDGIRVHPRAVELPPAALPLGALAAMITALVGPAIITWRQNEVLAAMRRRVHLQSWMLRQIIPAEADTTGRHPAAVSSGSGR